MSDQFKGHTYVDIKTLKLVSLNSQRSIDLKNIVASFEVFGSIFAPTMVGALTLNDGSALLQELPIVGEELLEVEFETPNRKPFQKLMYVYFPENMEFNPNGSHISITLHFASVDDFPGKIAYVNKGYKDNISKIVEGVLKFTKTSSPLNLEQTKGIELINIPGWNVWKSVEFLRARAISTRYNSPYLFFEDNEGYNFCSYEYLIEQRKKNADNLLFTSNSYLPEAGSSSVGNATVLRRQYRNVDNLQIESKPNTFKQILEGGASSRTVVFDILNKSIKNIDTKYDDAKSIVKEPLGKQFNPSHDSKTMKPIDNIPTRTFLMPTDSTNPAAVVDQYGKKNMYISMLQENKISFNTSGDSELQPGDVIKFVMPATSNYKEPDKQLTGNYLIGQLRHGISDTQMFTTVTAYKLGTEQNAA